jgi:hypothetical protein
MSHLTLLGALSLLERKDSMALAWQQHLNGAVKERCAQYLLARHGPGPAGEMRAAAELMKSKPKDSQPLLVLGDLPSSFLKD